MTDRPEDRDSCRSFHELFLHYRRGELGASDAERVGRHLELCADCRRFDEVEAGFDALLARGLSGASPPEGMQDRLRRRLEEAGPPASARRGFRPPLWAGVAAAAAMLVVGLLLPSPFRAPGTGAPADAGARAERPAGPVEGEVELAGMLVDDDCDRAGAPVEYQRECDDPRHHTVLRTDAGEYVALALHGDAAPLHRGHRGRRVVARGRYQALTGTLNLARYRFL
jgi:hypothetical protein